MHANDRSLLRQWYSDLVRKLTVPNTRSDDPLTYRTLQNVKLIGDMLDENSNDVLSKLQQKGKNTAVESNRISYEVRYRDDKSTEAE